MHKTRFKDWVLTEVEGKVKSKEKEAIEKAKAARDPSKAKEKKSDTSSEDRYDPLAHSDSEDEDMEEGALDEFGQPKTLSSFAVIKKMMKLKARQDLDPNYFKPQQY